MKSPAQWHRENGGVSILMEVGDGTPDGGKDTGTIGTAIGQG